MSSRVKRGFDPDALRAARLRAGMSRGDLGRRAQLSATTIQFWENGNTGPRVDSLARVAAVLAIPVSDLVQVPPESRMLSDLRNLTGMTQADLAIRLGVSTATVSNLELGYTKLPDRLIAPMAEALRVNTSTVIAAYDRGRNRD